MTERGDAWRADREQRYGNRSDIRAARDEAASDERWAGA